MPSPLRIICRPVDFETFLMTATFTGNWWNLEKSVWLLVHLVETSWRTDLEENVSVRRWNKGEKTTVHFVCTYLEVIWKDIDNKDRLNNFIHLFYNKVCLFSLAHFFTWKLALLRTFCSYAPLLSAAALIVKKFSKTDRKRRRKVQYSLLVSFDQALSRRCHI